MDKSLEAVGAPAQNVSKQLVEVKSEETIYIHIKCMERNIVQNYPFSLKFSLQVLQVLGEVFFSELGNQNFLIHKLYKLCNNSENVIK